MIIYHSSRFFLFAARPALLIFSLLLFFHHSREKPQSNSVRYLLRRYSAYRSELFLVDSFILTSGAQRSQLHIMRGKWLSTTDPRGMNSAKECLAFIHATVK